LKKKISIVGDGPLFFEVGVRGVGNIQGHEYFFIAFRLRMTFFWWAILCERILISKTKIIIVERPFFILALLRLCTFFLAVPELFCGIDQLPLPPAPPFQKIMVRPLRYEILRSELSQRGETN